MPTTVLPTEARYLSVNPADLVAVLAGDLAAVGADPVAFEALQRGVAARRLTLLRHDPDRIAAFDAAVAACSPELLDAVRPPGAPR